MAMLEIKRIKYNTNKIFFLQFINTKNGAEFIKSGPCIYS